MDSLEFMLHPVYKLYIFSIQLMFFLAVIMNYSYYNIIFLPN